MNQQKDGYLQTIHTTCAYCGVGCGIEAKVDRKAHTVDITGLGSHPSNYGRLCSKGTALGATLDLPGRLLTPEIDGQQASWDDALDAIAAGFRQSIEEHGPDSVAFYLSGQLLTEDYYVANKLMKGFIGSANVDTNSRLCMSSSASGHKRAFGTDTVPGVYEDFEHAELIVLVGSNTAWCHPVLFQRIKKYKESNSNLKVIVVDPRRTQTCEIADLHLAINLGSDTLLFNTLLNAINQRNITNHKYLKQYCEGYEEAFDEAQKQPQELCEVASMLGVSEDDLSTFIDWFCEFEKTVTLYSQGVNQSSSGTDKVNSIINCHLATGRIGRPGMGPFSMTGQPNAMGGREVGGLANTLAAHLEFEPDATTLVKEFWGGPTIATKSGLTAVELFDAMDKGKIKAVWILATNPAVSLPNSDQVKSALEKCPLVVVSDCVNDTDTLRLANVKLPATGWSEKDGTVTSSERRISRQRALFPKSGEAQHDWWAICEVAKRLGYAEHFTYSNSADIFREHAALSGYKNDASGRLRDFDISGLSNISDSDYDEFQPRQWPVQQLNDDKTTRFFGDGGFYTPNRRGRLIPITPKAPQESISNEYPFRLNTGRIRDQWHTMTRTALAPQLNQHINESFIQMHPKNAQSLGLKNEQIVDIESKWGCASAPLQITTDCKVGDVFSPMHWTDVTSKEAPINSVVNPFVDLVSGQPESKHTPVKVSAAEVRFHGLLMTNLPHNWSIIEQSLSQLGLHYANKVLGKSQYATKFSTKKAPQSSIELIQSLLKGIVENNNSEALDKLEMLSYEDAFSNDARAAFVDTKGRLIAVAMASPNPLNIDSVWLGQQFGEPLGDRSRRYLLSGFAPAGEDIGKVVCACFTVGENTLRTAIRNGCKSTLDIGKELKAGTNCGSCLPEIKILIDAETEN